MKIAGLMKNDFTDGNDVCVSLWVQGCPLHCSGCQNPQTWSFDGGSPEPPDLVQQIKSAITANGIQRNFSVLGGEPLCKENIFEVSKIIQEIRSSFPEIKIFVWTGKYLYDLKKESEIAEPLTIILKSIDVLIDGPFVQEERDTTLPLRGSRNQNILYKGKDF